MLLFYIFKGGFYFIMTYLSVSHQVCAYMRNPLFNEQKLPTSQISKGNIQTLRNKKNNF